MKHILLIVESNIYQTNEHKSLLKNKLLSLPIVWRSKLFWIFIDFREHILLLVGSSMIQYICNILTLNDTLLYELYVRMANICHYSPL